MLRSPQSIEDSSVTCTPNTYPSPPFPLRRSVFASPTSPPLEITPKGYEIVKDDKRRPCDAPEVYSRRVRTSSLFTTPDSTSSSYPPHLTIPTTRLEYVPEWIMSRIFVSPPPELRLPLSIDTQPLKPTLVKPDLEETPFVFDAIVEARKALTAMGRALNCRDRTGVEISLLAAIETLRTCYDDHLVSQVDGRTGGLESGEITPVLHTPVPIAKDDCEILPSTPHLDGPGMTQLIASSAIGPLRDLVQLRQKQERDLEEKNLEIEITRKDNVELTNQVARLEKELYKAKIGPQLGDKSTSSKAESELIVLRSRNEHLKRKSKDQATHLTALLAQCARLKTDRAKRELEDQIMTRVTRSKSSATVSSPSSLRLVRSTDTPPKNPRPATGIVKVGVTADTSASGVSTSLNDLECGSLKKPRRRERMQEPKIQPVRKRNASDEPEEATLESHEKVAPDNGPEPKRVKRTSAPVCERSRDREGRRPVKSQKKSKADIITHPTLRPPLHWGVKGFECPSDHGEVDISLTTADIARAPKRLGNVDRASQGEILIRGRGQVRDPQEIDQPSRLRMDAWNACLSSR